MDFPLYPVPSPVVLGTSAVGILTAGYILYRRRVRISSLPKFDWSSAIDVNDKWIVVTGAGGGLGARLCGHLLERGAKVICVVRNKEKTFETYGEMFKDSNKKLSMTLLVGDLSIKTDVVNIGDKIAQITDRVHILVNNAGVMFHPYGVLEGWKPASLETHMGINYVSHVQLTNQLLPLLTTAAGDWSEARVVNVSSGYYTRVGNEGAIEAIDSQLHASEEMPCDYKSGVAYSYSKLAMNLHALQLSKEENAVKAYSCTPGFVRGTDLGRHVVNNMMPRMFRENFLGSLFAGFMNMLTAPLIWMFSRDVDQGVQTMLHVTLAPVERLENGAFYSDCKVQEFTTAVNEENMIKLDTMTKEVLAMK